MLVGYRFSRPADQALFDLLSTLSELSTESECRAVIAEAEKLIAYGADVNAKAAASEIPDARLPACVLNDWSFNPPFEKLAFVKLLLVSGFDPALDEGRNGALTLAHYIKGGFANREFLVGLKLLLHAGCDPAVPCRLFIDEVIPADARYYAWEELADAFDDDGDFAKMLGFSAVWACIDRRVGGRNYAGADLVTQAFNTRLLSVRTFGGFRLQAADENHWRFGKKGHEPFASGLILTTRSTCLCLDPYWGAYCDAELRNMPSDAEVDLGIDGRFLTGMNGSASQQAYFRLRFADDDRVLVIDGVNGTVLHESEKSAFTDACEVLLPKKYGI